MARKFKVGDKVKIVKDVLIGNADNHGLKLRRIGTVEGIEDLDYPYSVRFRNQPGIVWLNARELELVKRKGNK